ncbi:MAG: hypothetical protein GF331_23090 [Chitinivibrionales bacterium]|nr:hypothetical protein [Chitinivibrionales bacterium]
MQPQHEPVAKVNPSAILQSSIVAVLVFIFVDSALEYLVRGISGTTVLHTFGQQEQRTYGMHFHAVNLGLFAAEVCLMMTFYALIRPRFGSRLPAAFIAAAVNLLLLALFLGQIVNLGIYPLRVALLFLATTVPSSMVSVLAGALVYDRAAND